MGKFILKKNSSERFEFNLKAGNGEVIATSQSFDDEISCRKGIEIVRRSAEESVVEDKTIRGFPNLSDPKFEIYKDAEGNFRFKLRAINGKDILASGSYTVKASCKNGIASVKRNAPNSPVIEEEI